MTRLLPSLASLLVASGLGACKSEDGQARCEMPSVALGDLCLSGFAREFPEAQAMIDYDGNGVDEMLAIRAGFSMVMADSGSGYRLVEEVSDELLGGPPFVIDDVDIDGIDELGAFVEPEVAGDPAMVRIVQWVYGLYEFTVAYEFPAELPTPVHGHVVGDFDGDGRPDLAFYGDDTIALHLRTDDGFGPTVHVEPFEASDARPPVVADLDGDGSDELVQAAVDHLAVRTGGSLGTATDIPAPDGYALDHLFAADVDDDDDDELAAWTTDASTVTVTGVILDVDAAGTATVRNELASDGIQVLLADVDRDGRPDLVFPGAAQKLELEGLQIGHVQRAESDGYGDPIEIIGLGHARWELGHLNGDSYDDFVGWEDPPAPCPHPVCGQVVAAIASSQ